MAAYGASSTSYYTSQEKKDHYESLEDILSTKCRDEKLRSCISDMIEVCAKITDALRSALVTVEGSSNDFGDSVLSVDVIADKLMWDAVKQSSTIREGASEEDPIVRNVDNEAGEGEYTVCWDPLDGSSIVDNNWAVGTMMGVWPKSTGLISATGRDQVTSIVALYGPRTTALVALDDGVYEFSYGCKPTDADAQQTFARWICTRHQIKIKPQSKIFAPANLRAAKELPGYQKLIDYFLENRYTLRYTGGMVPDVYQQFTKGQGCFTSPIAPGSPPKLRLAFEAAPFALLVEKAGGKTSDAISGGSILDVKIIAVDQRTAVCLGSADEVDRFNAHVCSK